MRKAFTLIELMIVLAILATVIGLFVYRTNFLERREAKEELHSILFVIREAKETAILSGEAVELEFDIEDGIVKLSYFGREEVHFRILKLKKLKLQKISGKHRILFWSDGFADSGVTMCIEGLSSEKILTIRPITGKAMVKDV